MGRFDVHACTSLYSVGHIPCCRIRDYVVGCMSCRSVKAPFLCRSKLVLKKGYRQLRLRGTPACVNHDIDVHGVRIRNSCVVLTLNNNHYMCVTLKSCAPAGVFARGGKVYLLPFLSISSSVFSFFSYPHHPFPSTVSIVTFHLCCEADPLNTARGLGSPRSRSEGSRSLVKAIRYSVACSEIPSPMASSSSFCFCFILGITTALRDFAL